MTTLELWWLALAIAAVVVVVVAVLLGLIVAAAKSINRNAEAIWIEGKQIAGNTVSIWMLEKSNDHLEEMLDSTRALEKNTAAMDEKLRTLTGSIGSSSIGTRPVGRN
jgi:hypothetical protein